MDKDLIFKKKTSGQSTVELLILLAFMIPLSVGAVNAFYQAFDDSLPRLGGRLEKQLRSGNKPPFIFVR